MPTIKKKAKSIPKSSAPNWRLIAIVAVTVSVALFIALVANMSAQTKITTGTKAATANSALQQTKKRIELTNYLNSPAGKMAASDANEACQKTGPVGTNVKIDTQNDFCKANWNPIISCEKEGYIPDYTSGCGDLFTGFFRACCRKESELKKVDAKRNDFCTNQGMDKGCLVMCPGDANDYDRKKPEADKLGRESDTRCAAFSGGLGLSLGSFKSQPCCTADPAKFSKR